MNDVVRNERRPFTLLRRNPSSRGLPDLLTLLSVLLVLGLLAQPGQAADIDAARERARELQQRLDEAATQLAEIEVQLAEVEDRRLALGAERQRLVDELDQASERITTRARLLYQNRSIDPLLMFLSSGADTSTLSSLAVVNHATAGDQADTERLTNTRTRLGTVELELEGARARLRELRDEQAAVTAGLQDDLDGAEGYVAQLEAEARRRAEEEQRRQEAERRAAAARARAVRTPSGVARVCPVASPRSFTNDWGNPRSGGRRHKGTDILAARGQAVLAIVPGVWDIRSYGRSAGNWSILRGDDGTSYYYMHLEQHLVGDGARVSAGQLVATNGDTGNARGTPHVHFEQHPGGGGAVNPYPLLKAICG